MDGTGEGGPATVDDDPLFGVLEIVERQQAAVQAALEGLTAERVALAWERETFARQVQALQSGVQGAARAAVAEGLAGAAVEGVAAVQAATRPLLDRVAGVTVEAGQAEAALRRVVLWASWRLLGRGTFVVAVLAGLLWGTQLSVWWWSSWDVALLQARKAGMEAEIAGLQARRDELEASRAELERMGVLAKVTRCIPGNRPCIQVNEKAGAFGTASDYRVIQGY